MPCEGRGGLPSLEPQRTVLLFATRHAHALGKRPPSLDMHCSGNQGNQDMHGNLGQAQLQPEPGHALH